MDDGQPLAIEQVPGREGIERTLEQRRIPPVQQIAGDDEVVGPSRGDAVESCPEFGRVAVVAEVEI